MQCLQKSNKHEYTRSKYCLEQLHLAVVLHDEEDRCFSLFYFLLCALILSSIILGTEDFRGISPTKDVLWNTGHVVFQHSVKVFKDETNDLFCPARN